MLMINLTLVIWDICQKGNYQTNTENGIKPNLVKCHFIALIKVVS